MSHTDVVNTAATDRLQRDYQLVLAARERGCHQAYADLMQIYREPLYLLLLRMTHNTTTAADLTVETFGKAFMQLHRYAPTGSFSSWLFTIGVNTYIDHSRRRHIDTIPMTDVQREGENGTLEFQVASSLPNPEEQLIRMERDEAMRRIVDEMKEPYREIIQMRYYEDLSYDEIAQRLGIPLGTVKVRLSRAKDLLASVVKKKGGGAI